MKLGFTKCNRVSKKDEYFFFLSATTYQVIKMLFDVVAQGEERLKEARRLLAILAN